MGKKLLYLILTIIVSAVIGYMTATWTVNRRLPAGASSDEVAAVIPADRKAASSRHIEVKEVANLSDLSLIHI